MAETVEALVDAGKASAGPPLGPSLGPSGVNVKEVIDQINSKTKDMEGMQVPVKVKVEDDKSFTIEVGTPPASSLIKQILNIEKGSGEAGSVVAADLTVSFYSSKKIFKRLLAPFRFPVQSLVHCVRLR